MSDTRVDGGAARPYTAERNRWSREIKILMRLPDGRNVATRQAVHGSAPCARTDITGRLQTFSELGQRPPFAIGQVQTTLDLISKNSILGVLCGACAVCCW